jgi:hypothetical protein
MLAVAVPWIVNVIDDTASTHGALATPVIVKVTVPDVISAALGV